MPVAEMTQGLVCEKRVDWGDVELATRYGGDTVCLGLGDELPYAVQVLVVSNSQRRLPVLLRLGNVLGDGGETVDG